PSDVATPVMNIQQHSTTLTHPLHSTQQEQQRTMEAPHIEKVNAREATQQAQITALTMQNERKSGLNKLDEGQIDPPKTYKATALPCKYEPDTRFAKTIEETSEEQEFRTTCGVLWEVRQSIPASLIPQDKMKGLFYKEVDLPMDDILHIGKHEIRRDSAGFQKLLAFDSSQEEGSYERYPLLPPLLIESSPTTEDALGGAFQTPIIRQ
ncbi:15267_t:CDS:2, partial [Acaulospora colombiana]